MRHIILKRTGIITILLAFCSLSAISQINGVVNYHENPANPLPNVVVDLYDENDVFIATTQTTTMGQFAFNNIPDGNYYISAEADLLTGEVDLIDASMVLQYLFGWTTFTDYEFIAADVNGSGNVTFGDYILILVSHIMQGNPFPVDDWHFDDVMVTVSSSKNTTETYVVWGTSAGDVEGIWQPGGRDLDLIEFENSNITEISTNEVDLIVGSDYEETINGFNLNMLYPNRLIEITEVTGPDDNFHFDVNPETGSLKVIWLDESDNPGQTFHGESLFTVTVRKLVDNYNEEALFTVQEGGMVLNSRNDEIQDITIKLPTIKTVSNIERLEASSYPNPVVNTLNIKITSPEESSANITIYDIQGKLIKTIENINVYRGTQTININTDHLNTGQYIYTLKIGTENLHGRFVK